MGFSLLNKNAASCDCCYKKWIVITWHKIKGGLKSHWSFFAGSLVVMFGIEMEPWDQKYLERVVSQRALQMASLFPCKFCVVEFLCGVCLTSLFLAALTSFGAFQLGGISFAVFSSGISTTDSTSECKFGFSCYFFVLQSSSNCGFLYFWEELIIPKFQPQLWAECSFLCPMFCSMYFYMNVS